MASAARHNKVVARSQRGRPAAVVFLQGFKLQLLSSLFSFPTSQEGEASTFIFSSLCSGFALKEPPFFPQIVTNSGSFLQGGNVSLKLWRDPSPRRVDSFAGVSAVENVSVCQSLAAGGALHSRVSIWDVEVDGFACKAYTNVTEANFFFAGLAKSGVINNTLGSLVTTANVEKIPGLNTLGMSFSRIDYKAGVLNPPHTRPLATEILFVLDGQLDVGFITTANKLISKSIKKGEIFVFPKGLVHYQKNSGDKPASVLCAFNSQLPRIFSIVAALLPKNHSTTSV